MRVGRGIICLFLLLPAFVATIADEKQENKRPRDEMDAINDNDNDDDNDNDNDNDWTWQGRQTALI